MMNNNSYEINMLALKLILHSKIKYKKSHINKFINKYCKKIKYFS
jgi:hypothetical protein